MFDRLPSMIISTKYTSVDAEEGCFSPVCLMVTVCFFFGCLIGTPASATVDSNVLNPLPESQLISTADPETVLPLMRRLEGMCQFDEKKK